jgi:hypothetical protein
MKIHDFLKFKSGKGFRKVNNGIKEEVEENVAMLSSWYEIFREKLVENYRKTT